jgi:hypothetical protein
MKTITLITLLFACLILAGQTGWTQSSSPRELPRPPLPDGDLIRPWMDREAWRISIEYTKSDSAEANEDGVDQKTTTSISRSPESVEIIRFHPYWSIQITGSSSSQSLHYYAGYGNLFIKSPRQKESALYLREADEVGESSPIAQQILFTTMDGEFFGFEWIAPKYYIGIEEVNGVKCLRFEKEGVSAWVDLVRRQPVRWENAQEVRRFKRMKTPTSPDIPRNVVKRIQGLQKDVEAQKNRAPVRGG